MFGSENFFNKNYDRKNYYIRDSRKSQPSNYSRLDRQFSVRPINKLEKESIQSENSELKQQSDEGQTDKLKREITELKYSELDQECGEGQINQLLERLDEDFFYKTNTKELKEDFDNHLKFLLKNCININRSFSDAVWFLSIWLKISPDTLLKRLKKVKILNESIKKLEDLKYEINKTNLLELRKVGINSLINKFNVQERIKKLDIPNLEDQDSIEEFIQKLEKFIQELEELIQKLKEKNLKTDFNRTEYDHEGDKWYFPELLRIFSVVVKEKKVTSKEILDQLFETFDFFSTPEVFVTEIIGYDRLNLCINECPDIFKTDLLFKVNQFAKVNNKISLGLRSYTYLKEELEKENSKLAADMRAHLYRNTSSKQIKNQKVDLSIKSNPLINGRR